MKRYVWTAAILLAFIEIYSVRPHSPSEMDPSDPGIKHYLTGAIHVHTKLSDGGTGVEAIASAAKKAGLAFVVVTDINTAGSKDKATNYEGVDVFTEMEVATPAGHMLTFYSHTEAANLPDSRVTQLAWQHFQGKENVPGLFNIVAHPSHPDTPWNAFDRQPEGIEVFNFDSLWRKDWEESSIGFGVTLLTYPFSNFLAALRFSQNNRKDLTSWDSMNAISPGRFGILAEHSHSNIHLPLGGNFHWPRHEQMLKVGANVLFYEPPLATDFNERKKQIYDLIRQGKSAMIFNFIHPFQGNDWYLSCADKDYRSGDRVADANACEFVVRLPKNLDYPAVIRLWKSGELVKEERLLEPMARLPVSGRGAYRLEVWLEVRTLFRVMLSGEVPYLFYNPIYVQ